MNAKRTTPPPPHALQGVALAAFRFAPIHDASSLAVHLGGEGPAYVTIATDVLANLEATGKVRPDPARPGAFTLAVKGFNLAEEAYIRRGCRACLKGLHVRLTDGRVVEVLASRWTEGGDLTICVRQDGLYVPAEQATVVGDWPIKCCRPLASRRREVEARRAAVLAI